MILNFFRKLQSLTGLGFEFRVRKVGKRFILLV